VPFAVAVVGQFAHVRGKRRPGEHCPAIIDVGDPRQPVERATIALDAEGHGLAVDGSRFFLTDGDLLRIFDVSEPSAPAEIGDLELPWATQEVANVRRYS
jgi:hypothetical protein